MKEGDVIRVEISGRECRGYVNDVLAGTWYEGDRVPPPFSLLIQSLQPGQVERTLALDVRQIMLDMEDSGCD